MSLFLRIRPGCALALLVLVALAPTAGAAPWFHEVAAEVGLRFHHDTGATGELHMPEIMGPGCALFDADGDGRLDVYVVQGAPAAGGEGASGNRLFLNRGDAFEPVTDSGLEDRGCGMGVAIGDVNGDGRPDVFVTNVAADRLFLNRGGGKFADVSEAWGIGDTGWGCSAALRDLDGDGDLDLFVSHYVDWEPGKRCADPAGRPEFCGPKEYPPLPDRIFRNEGDRFVPWDEAGVAGSAAAGLGVTCADFDEDGRMDVYVANDAYANHLWINQGDGTFLDDALLLGAAFNVQGMAEAGMGVLAGDFDDDLDLDLFMTHLRQESNTLYAWEGFGFEDRTADFGLATASLPSTGFGTVAFDVELDGDLDLFVANGAVLRGEERPESGLEAPWRFYAEPNQFFVNEGGVLTVAPAATMGALGEHVEVSRGAAIGDLDDDGDLDVLVTNAHGALRLYRNDAPRAGRWLRVVPRLESGAVASGARVEVTAGSDRWLRLADPALSYLSSCDPRAHFGVGAHERVDGIVVVWPDGSRERFPGGATNAEFVVRRGEGVSVGAR